MPLKHKNTKKCTRNYLVKFCIPMKSGLCFSGEGPSGNL